jgi:hypothetical protein
VGHRDPTLAAARMGHPPSQERSLTATLIGLGEPFHKKNGMADEGVGPTFCDAGHRPGQDVGQVRAQRRPAALLVRLAFAYLAYFAVDIWPLDPESFPGRRSSRNPFRTPRNENKEPLAP